MMEEDLFYKRNSSKLLWDFQGERSHLAVELAGVAGGGVGESFLCGFGETVMGQEGVLGGHGFSKKEKGGKTVSSFGTWLGFGEIRLKGN